MKRLTEKDKKKIMDDIYLRYGDRNLSDEVLLEIAQKILDKQLSK